MLKTKEQKKATTTPLVKKVFEDFFAAQIEVTPHCIISSD
jgi:hypothetical protein